MNFQYIAIVVWVNCSLVKIVTREVESPRHQPHALSAEELTKHIERLGRDLDDLSSRSGVYKDAC